jgi:hypothetical protein
MGKNKNDKKSPAEKKVTPETTGTNNTDMVNAGVSKSRAGKKEEGVKMKSKNKSI